MWLFNIFSNNKKAESSESLHNKESLRKMLASKRAGMEKSFVEVALSRYNEIIIITNDMEKKLDAFDNSDTGSDRIDPHLLQVLIGNKKTLSKKLHDICDILKGPMGDNKNSVINYFNSSYSILTDAVSSSIMNYRKIEDHFDKIVGPIVKDVNSIIPIMASFKKEVDNFQTKIAEIDSVENILDELDSQASRKADLQNEKLSAGGELRELENEKSSLETKLENAISSEIYKRYTKLIDEKEQAERKLEENKSKLINFISPLDKPMRKFLKLAEGDIHLKRIKDLEKFIEDHDLTKDNIALIKEIVYKMKPVVHKLELKENTVKKVVRRLEEGNLLDDIYQEKTEIIESLRSIEMEISASTPREKIEIEDSISRLESSMNSIEKELRTIENEMSLTENRIVRQMRMLEPAFKSLG
ncbi:MAG: hypothetical protein HYW24_02235 [Candidatus Aenigmarchaeota archaeon]|nr:hypothetical protein [Candidatus Aenigmarchaeota archaeon]